MSHSVTERDRDYELHYFGHNRVLERKAELTAGIRAVVVRAWQEGTLTPQSPHYENGPPEEWR